jgi:hypothetical protein
MPKVSLDKNIRRRRGSRSRNAVQPRTQMIGIRDFEIKEQQGMNCQTTIHILFSLSKKLAKYFSRDARADTKFVRRNRSAHEWAGVNGAVI